MSCECLKVNEEKLAEHYRAQGVVNPDVSADFLGIDFSTGETVITLNYTIRGDSRPYNTVKGKPCSMVASFCPWCCKSVKASAATDDESQ